MTAPLKSARGARPYADPNHPMNAETFRSGRVCIERGCVRPAGTGWSAFWCQPCNTVRMDRIGNSLRQLVADARCPRPFAKPTT